MIENKLNCVLATWNHKTDGDDDCHEWFDKYSIYATRKNGSSQILLLKNVDDFIDYFDECMAEASENGPTIFVPIAIQVELLLFLFFLFCFTQG